MIEQNVFEQNHRNIQTIKEYLGKKRKGAFSLIETLVVIAIIAIFILQVVPYLQDTFKSAETVSTESTLLELKKAALAYRANNITGQLPDNMSELLEGLSDSQSRTRTGMKLIDKAEWFNNGTPNPSAVVDQWGNQITYTKSSTPGESSVSSTGNGERTIELKF